MGIARCQAIGDIPVLGLAHHACRQIGRRNRPARLIDGVVIFMSSCSNVGSDEEIALHADNVAIAQRREP